MFIPFCGKNIQDYMYNILSESTGFCIWYDKNILVHFSGSQFQLPFTYKTRTLSFTG